MYKVELWFDIYFEIVDNYLKELVFLGEKVVIVIVLDYLWVG